MLTGLVNRFYDDLWNRWDDEVVDSLLAADFRFRGSLGEETIGRDGWRGYRDRVRAGATVFHNEIEELIVEGNRAAARLAYSGTPANCWGSLPLTGRSSTRVPRSSAAAELS